MELQDRSHTGVTAYTQVSGFCVCVFWTYEPNTHHNFSKSNILHLLVCKWSRPSHSKSVWFKPAGKPDSCSQDIRGQLNSNDFRKLKNCKEVETSIGNISRLSGHLGRSKHHVISDKKKGECFDISC